MEAALESSPLIMGLEHQRGDALRREVFSLRRRAGESHKDLHHLVVVLAQLQGKNLHLRVREAARGVAQHWHLCKPSPLNRLCRPRKGRRRGPDRIAIDAVRQWRYAPTVLCGTPVPVRLTVSVTFDDELNLQGKRANRSFSRY